MQSLGWTAFKTLRGNIPNLKSLGLSVGQPPKKIREGVPHLKSLGWAAPKTI